MSLRAKKTKRRHLMHVRAQRLVERLGLTHAIIRGDQISTVVEAIRDELYQVANHHYTVGRSAGIAEGRRRAHSTGGG